MAKNVSSSCLERALSCSIAFCCVLAIPLGAIAQLGFIWLMADTFNATMAIPNLIALALLSPVVFKLTKDYFAGKEVLAGEELDHDK